MTVSKDMLLLWKSSFISQIFSKHWRSILGNYAEECNEFVLYDLYVRSLSYMQQDVAFVGLWRKSWMTLKNNKTLLFDTIWYTRRTI